MDRIITAHTPLPPEQLLFRGMYGQEALSQLFDFSVELVSESYSLDLKQLLGKPLTLEIETAGDTRYLNGQITRCTLVGRENATSRNYIYRATVRPWLWYLTQTSDNKIFQNKSVPDVIKEVLADYKFPMEMRLSSTYRPWEYCVQYQETDFAFVSRLMEHEGIYYWFKHEDGKHTLVLTDDITQHETLPGTSSIPYYGPDRTTVPQEEYVSSWEVAEQITPGGFATNDFDFKRPGTSLDSKRLNPGAYDNGDLEVYEWLGGYTDPEQAEHYTRVRLQDLQSRQEMVSGSSNVRTLAPGYLVTLRNHPRESENREYLIVATRYRVHEGGYSSGSGGSGMFDVDFTVLPSSTQFRAPRVTPMSHTHGPQTATVVGKEGQQIWVDQYGRIKVQFHWDRYGQKNENSSCWVRVSSPWASGGFGGIQPPRRGDEVVVDFIGGHPDRPIVIGRVYNGGNMPPWDLPANATQSGFLTRSQDGTPHTANAFMFEDKPGSEEVWLHAERNMRTEVEANELRSVDGMRTTTIGMNDTTSILGSRLIQVTGTDVLTVGKTRDVTVAQTETYTVNGARTLHVSGGMTTENFDKGLKTTVAADGETREVTGAFKETLHTGQEIEVTGKDALRHVQAGTMTEKAKGKVSLESTDDAMDVLAKQHMLVQSSAAGMDMKAHGQIVMASDTAGIDLKSPKNITATTPEDVILTGKHVKTVADNGWFKKTPYSVGLIGTQTNIGANNNAAWLTQTGAVGLKMDAAALKYDTSYIAYKTGYLEIKNKALDSTTGTLRTALWALWVQY
jgi:type VI secretion system secreted protein VgrG